MKLQPAHLITVLVTTVSPAFAANLLFEDFEDATVTYTLAPAAGEFSDGGRDYFGRVSATGITIGGGVVFSNPQGTGFFAGQDLDGEGEAATQTINFTGILILNFENLSFSGFFAEDDDSTNQDWDNSDSLIVEAQIDGGGYVPVFQIENDDSQFNAAPLVDTDFDGVGDGDEITDTFTQFTTPISGTGNSLDLRITIALDSGDEDIAFDNISIDGDAAVPEPSTALLGGLALLGLFRRGR